MLSLYNMNSKEVVKHLMKDGFELVSQKGSHKKFRKDKLTVIVPDHGKKDLPAGTLNSIKKQAAWK
jgi:predicted RNA binding protein YcfA (HicA-like mRNA interferase family)